MTDWKQEWFAIDDATYLNFAAHAVVPRTALDALNRSIEAKKKPHLVDDAQFFEVAASLRASLATLIGANPDEVALTDGAGAGVAMLAYALKWRPGDEVLIAAGEFPMHFATWKPMEAREGIALKVISPHGEFVEAADFIQALGPRTRLISVSHVRFDDASMLDVPLLAAACKRNGTLLALDVSQSCGAVPIDVWQLGADFLTCAGYKYLLSPWGTGFSWAHRRMNTELRPGPYNWLSQGVATFERINYQRPEPSPSMSRWDTSEASSLYNFNLTVMEASLRFVLRAGPARVHAHTQSLINDLFARLPAGCYRASPAESARRGVSGCIVAQDRESTVALYRHLRARKFVVALREGRIRIAPHLLNSRDDIDGLITAISQPTVGG